MLRLAACGAAAAAAPAVYFKVSAAEPGVVKPNTIRACDLPLYVEPRKYEIVEYTSDEVTPLEDSVSRLRKIVWKSADDMQAITVAGFTLKDTISTLKDKWAVSKAHTQDLVTYIREDRGALPRAGIITVAGLGGVVAGFRGGVVRKTFYASAAMVAAASLCYPDQAVDLSTRGFERMKTRLPNLVTDLMTAPAIENTTKAESNEAATAGDQEKTESSKDVKTTADSKASSSGKVDKNKMDFGQSKKEDQDLYTTRTK